MKCQVGSIVRFGFGDNDFVAFSLQTHHLLQLMLGATILILFQFRFGHFTADYHHLTVNQKLYRQYIHKIQGLDDEPLLSNSVEKANLMVYQKI